MSSLFRVGIPDLDSLLGAGFPIDMLEHDEVGELFKGQKGFWSFVLLTLEGEPVAYWRCRVKTAQRINAEIKEIYKAKNEGYIMFGSDNSGSNTWSRKLNSLPALAFCGAMPKALWFRGEHPTPLSL